MRSLSDGQDQGPGEPDPPSPELWRVVTSELKFPHAAAGSSVAGALKNKISSAPATLMRGGTLLGARSARGARHSLQTREQHA